MDLLYLPNISFSMSECSQTWHSSVGKLQSSNQRLLTLRKVHFELAETPLLTLFGFHTD